jgi:hypothetical protein
MFRLKPGEPLQMVDAPAVRDVTATLEVAARALRTLTGDAVSEPVATVRLGDEPENDTPMEEEKPAGWSSS